MATSTSVRGRFLWYEILTDDPKGSRAFYSKVVEWDTMEWNEMEEPYVMWAVGQMPVGGIMQLPDEAKAQGAGSHWLCYVGVDDVDAAVTQIGQLGGTTMAAPMDIPTVGRMAVCEDPQGALFAVFKPEHVMPETPPQPRTFSWHELATSDHSAAYEFYQTLFGWQLAAAHDIGSMGTYQLFRRSAAPVGGMFNKPAEMPGPPAWLPYAMVADIDAAAKRVTEAGGKVIRGPMEVPGGTKVLQGLDPQGAMFALHALGDSA